MSESQWMGLVAGLIVLIYLAPGLRRIPQGEVVRNIALWLGVALLIAFGYRMFGPG